MSDDAEFDLRLVRACVGSFPLVQCWPLSTMCTLLGVAGGLIHQSRLKLIVGRTKRIDRR